MCHVSKAQAWEKQDFHWTTLLLQIYQNYIYSFLVNNMISCFVFFGYKSCQCSTYTQKYAYIDSVRNLKRQMSQLSSDDDTTSYISSIYCCVKLSKYQFRHIYGLVFPCHSYQCLCWSVGNLEGVGLNRFPQFLPTLVKFQLKHNSF